MVTDILDPWDEGMVSPGSTDVSDVSWKTPTMEFNTTTFVLGIPGHSWQSVACSGMSIGHKSLLFASKIIVGTALDLLTKPEQLKEVQKEFTERLKNRIYKTPIPDEIQPPLEIAKESARER